MTHRSTSGSHTNDTVELSPADALFAMLDGQVIRGRTGAAWRTEVASVVAEPDATWIQLGPAGRPGVAVTLRMAPGQRPTLALEALTAWLDLPPECRPTRVDLSVFGPSGAGAATCLSGTL